MMFEHFEGRRRVPRPLAQRPHLSHLFRGKVDVEEANRLLEAEGHDDLRLLDNGAIGREISRSTAHPSLPPRPQDWSARRAPSPHTPRPAATTADCIGVRRSVEDLESPPVSAASSSSPTGPSATPALRAALAAWDNVTVTEGAMGEGFYEAVVSTLMA